MKLMILITIFISLVFAKVDINRATKKELITLHGIGAKKAEAIIDYRNKRCFKSTYEISNVKGIGEKSFKKLKDNIEVSKCKDNI